MIANKVVYFMERNQLETYLKEMRALLGHWNWALKRLLANITIIIKMRTVNL